MKAILVLAPALLVGPAAAAQPQWAAPYKALGTEPFWSLTIDSRTIRFEDAERRTSIVSAPVPRPSFNGLRYITPRITVDITRSRCSDGMSDRTYPDSVTVTIGRRILHGCGGAPVAAPAPAAEIIAGAWRIVSVGDQPTRGPKPLTVSFAGNRIGGSTGCNSFGGKYRFDRGFLTVTGPLISTQMACLGPIMTQERAILAVLDGRLSVSTGSGGKLVLTGRHGRRLVLAR